jgi:acyl-CoA thioesterase FadM
MVAAPWVPDVALGLDDRKVRPEFMWAALDCPGYFAARSDHAPMLLGEFTAHVDRRVHVDEPCVIVGWRVSAAGRKFEVGTALFDEDGELCAKARAVWIELRPTPSRPAA